MFGPDNNLSLALRVENISKIYYNKLNHQNSIFNNVSFNIYDGDCIGLIGKNGSGKTTLLKIISGLVKPSTGGIYLYRKVVSIIELGQHLIAELDGLENIKMNMRIYNIPDDKFDLIVDFADIGEDINKPVKNFSSGMTLRLAFAIFIFVEADIYLFDEVITVGDFNFKEKCLLKFNDLISLKKTIIFASHDLDFILAFCNKCIWLNKDNSLFAHTDDCIKQYTNKFATKNLKLYKTEKIFELIDVVVLQSIDDVKGSVTVKVTVCFELLVKANLGITILIFKNDTLPFYSNGQTYFHKNNAALYYKDAGVYSADFIFEDTIFRQGKYSISLDVHDAEQVIYASFKNIKFFDVKPVYLPEVFDDRFVFQTNHDWVFKHHESIKGLFVKDQLLSKKLIKDGYVYLPPLPLDMVAQLKQFYASIDNIGHLENGNMISILADNKQMRKHVHDYLVSCLTPYLSTFFENFKIFIAYFIVKKHCGENRIGCHQEPTFVDADLFDDFTIWFSLDDILHVNDGMLGICKYSHLWANRVNCKNFMPAYLLKEDDLNLQYLPTHAGQPILFYNRIIHASALNTRLQNRVAISIKLCNSEAHIYSYFFNDNEQAMQMYLQNDDYYFSEHWSQDAPPPSEKFVKKWVQSKL